MKDEFDHETNIAYLVFKRPGDATQNYYQCQYIESRDLSDIHDCDFVFAPFSTQSEAILFLKFDKELEKHELDSRLLCSKILEDISRAEYGLQFQKLKRRILNGDIDKLVLSRIKAYRANKLLPQDIFNLLLTNYPDAFSYMLLIPDRMCWIGTSPEPLLQESGGAFLSSALAGTQALTLEPKDVFWGEKEREEHAFIETYLEESFRQAKLTYEKSDCYTVAAAEVCHIRSDFYLDKENDISELIKILHPGPALSGYPKELAVEMIPALEAHKRSYYTGYFGTLSKSLGLCLYANLRCMALYKEGAELYLGGGITKDSDEESEWQETELKSRTMGAVLEMLSNQKVQL